MTAIFILAFIGFCISFYAYFVETKIKKEPEYKPACDINDRISCSKPILSEYGNIFYFSNGLMGMIYYLIVAALAFFDASQLVLIAAIGGCLASAVLAYILYFKIKSLCIVCMSLYIVNILILLFSLHIL